jgi:phage replication-related protein YjqB (UPF0714/DUF867 family)
MTDKYACFDELTKEMNPGRDFRIQMEQRSGSDYLIIAPHGGKIEKGTSELARAIAREDTSFYLFEGIRQSGNADLHITSDKFDEPNALAIAGKHRKAIGIHGRKNRNDGQTVYLGGLDDQLVASLQERLSDSGFPANSDGHAFPARRPNNICNRGTSKSGAQLELPLNLRIDLLRSAERMTLFSDVVRMALIN